MPDINVPTPRSFSRQPRGAVKLNGQIINGVESWEVENNAYRAADTFSVTIAIGLMSLTPAWFGTQAEIDCEIFATSDAPDNYRPASSDSLIYGQVDDLDFDPVEGTVTLTGRDLTARLIDTKTSVNNLNQTSSQIAAQIAFNHGLKPVVTTTKTTIGTVYRNNASDVKQERSEWDILSELAAFENFDVFVIGQELHFQPKPADTGDRYAIVLTSDGGMPSVNATTLHFERSLTIAKGVSVTVRSWNQSKGKAFSASYPKATKPAKPGESGATDPIKYRFTRPGMTQDQCEQLAMQKYKEITQHMVKLSADLPGDGLLNCSKIVQVRGTGTAWDQDYFPDSVKRLMSFGEGYRMSVTAKNISDSIEAAQQ